MPTYTLELRDSNGNIVNAVQIDMMNVNRASNIVQNWINDYDGWGDYERRLADAVTEILDEDEL